MENESDHRNTLFVFPNKRAIIFMRRYLKKCMGKYAVMPKMRTIGAFLGSLCPLAEASRIEQLFTLYDAYCDIMSERGQAPSPFDRFRFWGEIILNDFDDIDRQLADSRDVFENVKKLEEIQVDFLDEEQRLVAKELWGYEPETFDGFKNNRKKHVGGEYDDIAYDSYIKLTEILYPLYTRFNDRLDKRGYATRGRIARLACQSISGMKMDSDIIPPRIAFIGFGVLSGSERKIFKILKNIGRAEFFWDVPVMLTRDLPSDMQGYRSPLSKYIDRLIKYFEMPPGFLPPSCNETPKIKILGVPSKTLQAKVAGNILQELNEAGEINTRISDDTVVVLPDASILIPLLHSLKVSSVNVTMGLPIRNTPFATLLRLIIRLNLSSTTDSEGRTLFLTQNVLPILTHPSLTILAPTQTLHLRRIIEKEHRFHTSFSTIAENSPEIGFIFEPINDRNTAEDARMFIVGLIEGLQKLIIANTHFTAQRENSRLHEYRILDAVHKAVDNLVEVIKTHSENLDLDTLSRLSFFKLVERLLFSEQINYTGSPLVGIQIAGALETRSLDFNNVLMLSMNEKTFPPKNFMRSLIPSAIRYGYGLTISEEKELEYAWIYANLLSRSKNVFLIYNSAAETKGNGGMSRYLFQTQYIYNKSNPLKIEVVPAGQTETASQIVINKDKDIIRELDRFKVGGDRYLSVSALEKYGECPLKFYFSKVSQIAEPKTIDETIDDATLGTMVHDVMQRIYDEGFISPSGQNNISENAIKDMLAESLNQLWYYGSKTPYSEMPHEARLQIDLWSRKIMQIVSLELSRAHTYKLEKCEMRPEHLTGEHVFNWFLNSDTAIRFTFSIDRVDRLNDGGLRFIDYKTGRDKLEVSNINNLFWQKSDGEDKIIPNKAVFQLLTYANAYIDLCKDAGLEVPEKIDLEITQVLNPKDSIGAKLTIGDEIIEFHNCAAVKDFRPMLEKFISSIFNPDIPFTQTENIGSCVYCQFKNICQRNPEKKF